MPFCPDCREEFRPDIQTCPGCNVKLVPVLQAGQGEDMAVAFTVMDEPQAHIIKGYLESEGIPCFLENVTFHMEPVPVPSLTKVRLWTKKKDVSEARQLIRKHEQMATCSACGYPVYEEDTVCESCGEGLNTS